MKKPVFTSKDIIEKIALHPDFTQVHGTYLLFTNSVPLLPVSEGVHFFCTQEDFDDFLNDLSQLLITLSSVSANDVPVGWVPFPGTSRGKVLSHYKDSKERDLDLISSDPNIVLVKKISDSDTRLLWEPMDGRIGHGGFSTV